MGKPDNSKTVRQWGLLGRIPIEGRNPSYIWDTISGKITTYYYLDCDTREMTEAEAKEFWEAENKKHPKSKKKPLK